MLHNLFSHIPADLPAELIEPLVSTGKVRIERIVTHGHASPGDFWYDQPEHEWVLLVQGAARLEVDDEAGLRTIEMRAGDYLHLPAHLRHRVAWTPPEEATIWLAVFYRD